MARLTIDSEKLAEEIIKKKAKKVLIQAPAGLKRKIADIVQKLEKETKARIFLSADSCFGACDIPIGTVKVLKPDLVLHIGHTKMLALQNISYFPLQYEFSKREKAVLLRLLIKELRSKGIRKACGVATIQYIELLRWLAKEAAKHGIKIVLKKGRYGVAGQVLGCETSAARSKAEAIVFVGDGVFHAIGIAKAEKKSVLILNPLAKHARWLEKKKLREIEKKRIATLFKAKQAKRFGIVLSVKPGQFNEKLALEAKRILEANGKKAVLIAADNITEHALLDFNLDCFVAIACPRLTDDAPYWKKPLIGFEDLLVLFNRN